MSKHATGIEWTHIPGFKGETWNPVTGCEVVSPGCTNCYAMQLAGTRLKHLDAYAGLTDDTKAGPVWNGKVFARSDVMAKPLHWKKPRAVFVNSMGDLFHQNVSDNDLLVIFAIMALSSQHTFMVLTKRPERMRTWLSADPKKPLYQSPEAGVARKAMEIAESLGEDTSDPWWDAFWQWPLPNIWLGVSVEDQVRANERIPALLATPAAKRFVSCEPLLGAVDLTSVDYIEYMKLAWRQRGLDQLNDPNLIFNTLTGHMRGPDDIGLPKLDWVIAGGESGCDARPMHPDWATGLRDQCAGADVPFFFKQWGEWTPGEHVERQTGTVPTASWFANQWTYGTEDLAWTEGHVDDAPDLYRVGKKAAGSQLFRETHHNWPGVS